jgi:hypothetical protein
MSLTEEEQRITRQLKNQLSEHFSCFCLCGFTMDGDRVMLVHSVTGKDYDSLHQMMEDTIEFQFKLRPVVRIEDEHE